MNVFKIVKNFICNPEIRINYLNGIGFYNKMDDKKYILKEWKIRMRNTCHIEEPKTFNEKMQWLKLYDRRPEYTNMVDKYEAKKYVSNIIGEEYIIPTLGIYEKFEDIDFEKLPNKFVLKPTHTSGDIFICNDKEKVDYPKLKKKVKKWLKRKYYYIHREWPYKNIQPRVIVEKYMKNEDTQDLKDYKFMCFNGKVKCSFVCSNRYLKKGLNIDFYDLDWNKMPFQRHYPNSNENIPKPINYELMIMLAEKLSTGIPFVRVDFYEINGKVYFGELTFFPGSGFEEFTPERYDEIIGDMLELPKQRIEEKK